MNKCLLIILLIIIIIIIFMINTLKYKFNNTSNVIIPKIIHQTYSEWDNIPYNVKQIIEDNRKMNKKWKYMFYSNKEIDTYIKKNESDYVYSAFKKINPKFGASLADFFRYVVMYHSGGVYMDIKSKCVVPLDICVHHNKLQVSFWTKHSNYSDCNQYHVCKLTDTKNREITQMALIFPKKHPLMRKVIDTMVEGIYNYKETDLLISDKVLYTTGPWLYTKVVAKYICENRNLVKLYDKEFYDGKIISDATYGEFTNDEIKKGNYYKNLKNIKYIL